MFSLFLAQVIFNEIDAKIGQIVCLIVPCEINETGVFARNFSYHAYLTEKYTTTTILQKEKGNVVNIPVYCRIQKSFDPTEEYFRDFRGFKMDQGLGLLLLNGLEWFEMGNNQPLTFCIFTF